MKQQLIWLISVNIQINARISFVFCQKIQTLSLGKCFITVAVENDLRYYAVELHGLKSKANLITIDTLCCSELCSLGSSSYTSTFSILSDAQKRIV